MSRMISTAKQRTGAAAARLRRAGARSRASVGSVGGVPVTVPVGTIDLGSTLASLVHLPNDPTIRLRPGSLDRATWTPDGPGALSVRWSDQGTAEVETHGEGAGWLIDRIDGMRFAPGKNTFEVAPSFSLRALKALHIEFDAKTPGETS